MLTVYRIANMVKSLDECQGVVVTIATPDQRCAYSRDLDEGETADLVAALSTWEQDCQGCAKLTAERDSFHIDLFVRIAKLSSEDQASLVCEVVEHLDAAFLHRVREVLDERTTPTRGPGHES